MAFPAFTLLIGAFCSLLAPFTQTPWLRGITIFLAVVLIGFFQLRFIAFLRKDRNGRKGYTVKQRNVAMRPTELPPRGVSIIGSYTREAAAS